MPKRGGQGTRPPWLEKPARACSMCRPSPRVKRKDSYEAEGPKHQPLNCQGRDTVDQSVTANLLNLSLRACEETAKPHPGFLSAMINEASRGPALARRNRRLQGATLQEALEGRADRVDTHVGNVSVDPFSALVDQRRSLWTPACQALESEILFVVLDTTKASPVTRVLRLRRIKWSG